MLGFLSDQSGGTQPALLAPVPGGPRGDAMPGFVHGVRCARGPRHAGCGATPLAVEGSGVVIGSRANSMHLAGDRGAEELRREVGVDDEWTPNSGRDPPQRTTAEMRDW